jgi:hypothetical protein
MTEANIIDLIITFAFGLSCFYAGYKYHEFVIIQEMLELSRRILRKMGKIQDDGTEVVNKSASEMHPLKHEEHNGVHFFYYEADDGFACQGKTLDEAAEKFNEITKGEGIGFFEITQGNLKGEYAFVEGKACEAAIGQVKL